VAHKSYLLALGWTAGTRAVSAPQKTARRGRVNGEKKSQKPNHQDMHPASHESPRGREIEKKSPEFRDTDVSLHPTSQTSRYANSTPPVRQTRVIGGRNTGRTVPTSRSGSGSPAGKMRTLGRSQTQEKKRRPWQLGTATAFGVNRTCSPPANGVDDCETDADRARDERVLFSGSGSTQWVWHLRRVAETGIEFSSMR